MSQCDHARKLMPSHLEICKLEVLKDPRMRKSKSHNFNLEFRVPTQFDGAHEISRPEVVQALVDDVVSSAT